MRKTIPTWSAAVMCIAFSGLTFMLGNAPVLIRKGGNFTEEMKISAPSPLDDDGADVWNRKLDHVDSPYFKSVDFYNAESNDSLFILPKYKTMQQTSWWSCGQADIMMALNYQGRMGGWTEANLAALGSDHSEQHIGTCLNQMIEMLDKVGEFDYETTYDYKDRLEEITPGFLKEQIKSGNQIIVGSINEGGHWTVLIGYDTMGTQIEHDDVLIMANSYDTLDHNQDGYSTMTVSLFLSTFSFYGFLPPDHVSDKCFIIIKPSK